MTEIKLAIKGTHCKACKMLIEDILEDMNIEIVSLSIDEARKEGVLVVKTEVEPQKIIEAIQAEGEYTLEIAS